MNDVIEHWRSLSAIPAWSPNLAVLHDLRQISASRTFSETLEAAEMYKSIVKAGDGKVAILVDSSVIFGLTRQLSIITGLESMTRVTTSAAEAKAWVGLPPDFLLATPSAPGEP